MEVKSCLVVDAPTVCASSSKVLYGFDLQCGVAGPFEGVSQFSTGRVCMLLAHVVPHVFPVALFGLRAALS